MASPTTPANLPPYTFLIALFPGFQLLDVCGPLDLFNFLPQPPYNAPLTMKIVAETSEAVGTKLIASQLPSGWEWDVKGAMGLKEDEEVNSGWQQRMVVDGTFEEVLKEVKGGGLKVDVLFIPGGVGSRVKRRRVDGDGKSELAVQPLVEFVRAIKPYLSVGIMTVCTGSDILGYTGLLDGRRATTNMARYGDVAGRHGRVKWEKGARWVKSGVEEDSGAKGKEGGGGVEIWTSAGVSAGMDVALAFIQEKFGGVEVARDIARKSEYDWAESKDGEICHFYKEYFGV